jgi:hypothetical protein
MVGEKGIEMTVVKLQDICPAKFLPSRFFKAIFRTASVRGNGLNLARQVRADVITRHM